ncbi:MFS transporter [Pseudomonas massiliensis]|uniref:MFS transporter n=1 Tax=Pseudomonas massiliensis TaxID=522492 RepID=UPI001E3930E1|nr:MFS transporter [Pseudomonas massiliensis]
MPPSSTAQAPARTQAAALSRPSSALIASLLLAMFLAALDQSVLATALPAIATDLHGIESLSWVVTAFMLTSTISAPLYGKLSDLYGPRPLFLFAIALIVAASVLCGACTSMGQLIAARGLQGLGAGGLMTLSQIVIGRSVKPSERGRYQGVFSATFAVSSAAGPLLGGFITSNFSWRWIFFINLPLGLLAMLGVARNVPRFSSQAKVAVDYAGAVTLGIATSALLLLTHAPALGFGGGVLPALVLAAVMILGYALLYRIERSAQAPIIDPALFRNRRFTVAICAMAAMAFAMMGSLVFMPLYYQAVLHQTPTESGFMTLPQVAMMVLSSFVGGAIATRRQNFAQLLLVGVALECLALCLLFAFTHAGLGAPWFFLTMGILGLGMGVGMPNATVLVQNAVSPAVMGAATAALSFCRSLGGAVGVAAAGGIMGYVLTQGAGALPISLGSIQIGDPQSLSQVPAAQLAQVTELYRQAINASLLAGALVMGFAVLLVAWLVRSAKRTPKA